MSFSSTNFNVKYHDLGEGNTLHVINIEEIDRKLNTLINQSISTICYGDDHTDISIIKKELINYFDSKTQNNDYRLTMGSIAEFIIHLYLNDIGFKQEFLFQNLEENSIKKGFDGLYTLKNEMWLFESKSGSSNTVNISHNSLINISYKDLFNKVSKKTSNNPWKNALNHAKIAGTTDDILKDIKKLSNEYILKKYQNIKDFNIIPSSTIFLEGNWIEIDELKITPKIKK